MLQAEARDWSAFSNAASDKAAMPLFLLTAFDYVNSHKLAETEHCDKFSTKKVLKAAGVHRVEVS